MKDKQNIDDLYYRNLKDVETTPPEAVWEKISSRLPKEKQKRSIPLLWYKMTGAAAALAILLHLIIGHKSDPTGAEFQIPAISVRQDLIREINQASETFKQQMLSTSNTLQSLQEDSGRPKQKDKPNRLSQDPTSKKILVAVTSLDKFQRKPLSRLIPTGFNSLVLQNYAADQPERSAPVKSDGSVTESELELLGKNRSREDPVENTFKKRFSIKAKMAPVYFDNMSRKNAMDDVFSPNESGGEISYSYGVNFAYQISENIRLRSGVSRVDLSYKTENVTFTSTVNSSALKEFPTTTTTIASSVSGNLNQNIGFIEVPMEVELLLLDKKINLNLIAGGSTLFLDQNRVSLNSSGSTTELGEANNLNKLSFSTNIGMGINYDFSTHLEFSLEPTFKYQINTFNTPGLHPYYFGFYSGLRFSF